MKKNNKSEKMTDFKDFRQKMTEDTGLRGCSASEPLREGEFRRIAQKMPRKRKLNFFQKTIAFCSEMW